MEGHAAVMHPKLLRALARRDSGAATTMPAATAQASRAGCKNVLRATRSAPLYFLRRTGTVRYLLDDSQWVRRGAKRVLGLLGWRKRRCLNQMS